MHPLILRRCGVGFLDEAKVRSKQDVVNRGKATDREIDEGTDAFGYGSVKNADLR